MSEFLSFAQEFGLPISVALLLGVLLYRSMERRIVALDLDLRAERKINDERSEKTLEAASAVRELTAVVQQQSPMIAEVLREVKDLRAVLRDTRPDYRPRNDRTEDR